MTSHPDVIIEERRKAPEDQLLPPGTHREPISPCRKVWIDLENSPHVPFFLPIISALEQKGYKVILTARDCFQVCALADLAKLKYVKIGHHYGKNKLAKVVGLCIRVIELTPFVLRERPVLCISHSSRSEDVLSAILRIPSISLTDYEYADSRLHRILGNKHKRWIMTPDVVPPDKYVGCGVPESHILHYPGLKEDVYVPFFKPDSSLVDALELPLDGITVTFRPPATEAHYHNPESEMLMWAVLDLLGKQSNVKTILLPRTTHQESDIRRERPNLFAQGKIVVPKGAVDGLNLIWFSDLVISGGGTMNREAAALGVPVYSIFRGPLGAVDRDLAEKGRLILLQTEQDIRDKLKLVHRDKNNALDSRKLDTLNAVLKQIQDVLQKCG